MMPEVCPTSIFGLARQGAQIRLRLGAYKFSRYDPASFFPREEAADSSAYCLKPTAAQPVLRPPRVRSKSNIKVT